MLLRTPQKPRFPAQVGARGGHQWTHRSPAFLSVHFQKQGSGDTGLHHRGDSLSHHVSGITPTGLTSQLPLTGPFRQEIEARGRPQRGRIRFHPLKSDHGQGQHSLLIPHALTTQLSCCCQRVHFQNPREKSKREPMAQDRTAACKTARVGPLRAVGSKFQGRGCWERAFLRMPKAGARGVGTRRRPHQAEPNPVPVLAS